MRIEEPSSGPPRPSGPRDPGDAWVVTDAGERYWGRFGAAGLLAHDAARGVLLQHRVSWSHHGGTWGIPGGARHQGESATDAAIRESHEEAGVPVAALRPKFTSFLDLGVWSYTTLVADVVDPFEPVIADPESYALEWVPLDEVDALPLHPGFADAWPALRDLLAVRLTVLVDAANVVGSVPDGWWRDRAGAASRLLERLQGLPRLGLAASELSLPGDTWYPDVVAVLEGEARAAADPAGSVGVVRADAAGDDTLVAEARRRVGDGERVLLVTSDRALGERAVAVGAEVRGVSWLRDRV
ncbi:NUDIX domain-containing protein [Microbacterium sp. 1P06AB]|uniref:NUDIX domain-containing protein n=1 Tax=Microbacterium sp. 1P06AB TaxID=3132289 RepID=UPI0039A57A59